jgi:hypothetical protein
LVVEEGGEKELEKRSEWFTDLQKRHGFHDIVVSEEAASADARVVKSFFIML